MDMNDGQGPSDQLCNLLPIACEEDNNPSDTALESGEGNTGGSGKSGGCEQGLAQDLPILMALIMCLALSLRRRHKV